MELRIDNICIGKSLNPEQCYYIRFMFNGNYLDLENQSVFSNSVFQINPYSDDDDKLTALREKTINSKYDMKYFDFENQLQDLMQVGYLKDICD
jgi:hypothetical protein